MSIPGQPHIEFFEPARETASLSAESDCLAGARESEREGLRVVDNLPDFVPISSKEIGVIEMFLGELLDEFVKS